MGLAAGTFSAGRPRQDAGNSSCSVWLRIPTHTHTQTHTFSPFPYCPGAGDLCLPCHTSERQPLRAGRLVAGVTLQKVFLRCLKGLAWLIKASPSRSGLEVTHWPWLCLRLWTLVELKTSPHHHWRGTGGWRGARGAQNSCQSRRRVNGRQGWDGTGVCRRREAERGGEASLEVRAWGG